jgi:hypothetical protein
VYEALSRPRESITALRSVTAPGLLVQQAVTGSDAAVPIDPVEGFKRHETADDALAVIGLAAIDAHVLGREPASDRQFQAGASACAAIAAISMPGQKGGATDWSYAEMPPE